MENQRLIIVSDAGESWALSGDEDHADESNAILPRLLNEGWRVASVTPGSGAKDDTSYWLVVLGKLE